MKLNRDKVYLYLAESGYLTVKELAEAAGMSASNLAGLLSGKTGTSRPSSVGRIARALGCRAADIVDF